MLILHLLLRSWSCVKWNSREALRIFINLSSLAVANAMTAPLSSCTMASSSSSAAASADSTPQLAHRNFFDHYEDEAAPTSNNAASNPAAADSAAASSSSDASSSSSDKSALLSYIDRSVVGKYTCLNGPWGWRRLTYADWTASGRGLSFIEDYIQSQVAPWYANTHTTASVTGLQTSLFRREAREMVKRAMRGSKDDALLFCGSGATGALKVLLSVLALPARARAHSAAGHSGPALVVLSGPYEHHSNMLPWREAGALMIAVSESKNGGVDLNDLQHKAEQAQSNYPHALRVGAFSAASNVSGILTETEAVTRMLHQYGALAVWDYAAAAPYIEVDANPMGNDASVAKDAIICSPHKFVGGPGAPGVLLVKKALCVNRVPATVGGGTVFFVTETDHRYLENFEEREEGGTQDTLGAIRAGLVFQLKEQVGIRTMAAKEAEYASLALRRLSAQKNLVLMGHPSAARLPIVSFLLRWDAPSPSRQFLHPNFVSALLNDLFGIQSRAGCLCAGPYGQRVLGIDSATAKEFERALIEKHELLRPGFTRVNLSWFASSEEIEFILSAIEFLAVHAASFLPLYGFTADSGEWKHKSRTRISLVGRKWLGNVDYSSGVMQYAGRGATAVETKEDRDPKAYERYMNEARALAAQLTQPSAHPAAVDQSALLPKDVAHLRWFVLPSEAARWIRDPQACRAQWNAQAQSGAVAARPAVEPIQYVLEGTVGIGAEASMVDEQKGGSASASAAAASASVAAAASSPASAATAFSLMAPTTAAQPSAATTFAPLKGKQEKGNKGQKRGAAEGAAPQTLQQLKDAKKQRKAALIAGSTPAASSTAASSDSNGDQTMADLSSSAAAAAAAPTPSTRSGDIDLRDDVCKNCWHVHWNAASAAAGAASSDVSKQSSQSFTKECTHCECIHFVRSARRSPKEVAQCATKIQKGVGAAIRDFDMVREGDRILIGISGGKDSLTLFHILRNLQRKSPVKFSLGCVTVDPQTPEYDPSSLKKYFAALNVPYFYESQPILAAAKASMGLGGSLCSFCARMKRGVLYTCMRREGYNVLALGQHLDDLAESLLMSVFHNGMLRTMKANYHAEKGDIRIIRPLIYVRERLMREYANVADLPVINENCPACFEAPKERQRVKLMLAAQEHVHANLFSNMLKAMRPLMGLENSRLAKPAAAASGATFSAAAAGMDDDDEEGSSSAAQNDQLRALQSIGAGSKGAGSAAEEDEDAAEYDALDALCKAPGGACALPQRKGGVKGARNSTAATSTAATDSSAVASSSSSSTAAADASDQQQPL